jgi:hypothetical protein
MRQFLELPRNTINGSDQGESPIGYILVLIGMGYLREQHQGKTSP